MAAFRRPYLSLRLHVAGKHPSHTCLAAGAQAFIQRVPVSGSNVNASSRRLRCLAEESCCQRLDPRENAGLAQHEAIGLPQFARPPIPDRDRSNVSGDRLGVHALRVHILVFDYNINSLVEALEGVKIFPKLLGYDVSIDNFEASPDNVCKLHHSHQTPHPIARVSRGQANYCSISNRPVHQLRLPPLFHHLTILLQSTPKITAPDRVQLLLQPSRDRNGLQSLLLREPLRLFLCRHHLLLNRY
mmetsp:Transcript_4542/g.10672  ORF Transcript_4542/g.10672 Transcript_4542/m.10672 type:complete len:244 (+) Transcript_4542:136-867(+)